MTTELFSSAGAILLVASAGLGAAIGLLRSGFGRAAFAAPLLVTRVRAGPLFITFSSGRLISRRRQGSTRPVSIFSGVAGASLLTLVRNIAFATSKAAFDELVCGTRFVASIAETLSGTSETLSIISLEMTDRDERFLYSRMNERTGLRIKSDPFQPRWQRIVSRRLDNPFSTFEYGEWKVHDSD
ncbi:MAG: hypothetical protein EKK29_21815 [Hyphomicrobiales bacterium]|nr:MAG: hypothetical protein EKK29_21815 [Hyphomicrobiales bacterium]